MVIWKYLFQEHFFIGWTNQSAQIVAPKQNPMDLCHQQMKIGDGKQGGWKLTNVQTVGKMKDSPDTIILGNCLVGI